MASVSAIVFSNGYCLPGFADPQVNTRVPFVLIAAKTESYGEKDGFHRDKKDIINTLKNNEVTSFQTMLDALQQAFELDKTLRGEGPFTVFAPSDKAWKRLTDADLQALFG
ncbi:MAG: fasciclin domain-containing protein, partial [Terriglobales bacterium]